MSQDMLYSELHKHCLSKCVSHFVAFGQSVILITVIALECEDFTVLQGACGATWWLYVRQRGRSK